VKLYDRRVELVVGKATPQANQPFVEALRITDLRVTFKVERDTKPTPNTAEITVYNLGPQSRAAFETKGVPVLLMAGYADGNVSQCFSGEARSVTSEKAGTDWVTRIRCGDGERGITMARVKESAKPGMKVGDILLKAAKAIAKDPGNTMEIAGNMVRTFSSGYAVHGSAAAELTRICAAEGLQWSVQDGRMQILKDGESIQEMGPLFTPDTGLIGTPTAATPDAKGGPQSWKVKVLLEPRLRPGQRFEVERTVSKDGRPAKREQFLAVKVTHAGDTHGGEWASEIEATQL
jgi:hypothetical protein